MRCGILIAFALVVGGIVSTISAQTLPPASEKRAERYSDWRSSIRSAERAVAHGRLDEAADAYLRIVEEAERIEDRSLLHVRALDGLAALRLGQGQYGEAERLYVRCIPLWERLLGVDQPRIAVTLTNLAVARMNGGDCDGARETFDRALVILDAAGEHGSAGAATARDGLLELDRRCTAER